MCAVATGASAQSLRPQLFMQSLDFAGKKAQPEDVKGMQLKSQYMTTATPAQFVSKKDIVSLQKAPRHANEDVKVRALYKNPNGALYYGISPEGWYSISWMFTDAFRDMEFWNYSDFDDTKKFNIKWTNVEGEEVVELKQNPRTYEGETSSWTYYNGLEQTFGRLSQFPTLTVQQDLTTETYQFVNYTYDNNGNVTDTKNAYWNGGTFEKSPLTNADPGDGIYLYWGQGQGFTTKSVFNNNSEGKKCVGFAQYFEAPAAEKVYASSLSLAAYPNGKFNAASLLDGKTMKAIIATYDDATEEWVTYAEGFATDADVVPVGNSGVYLINYIFKEEDEVFGSVEAPIFLPNEDFIVFLGGFEDLSTSISGLLTSDGWQGNGYAILEDGSMGYFTFSNSNTHGGNILVSFDAIIPVAEPAEADLVVDIPAEGGYGVTGTGTDSNGSPVSYYDYDIYTFTDLDDEEGWTIVDKPEWVEVSVNNTITSDGQEINTVDYYGILLFYFSAEALPAGTEGRGGEVVLELYGKQVVIPVKQGTFEFTGVQSPKSFASDTNKPTYNLAGQRVNENAKGLLIRDGKKFFRK